MLDESEPKENFVAKFEIVLFEVYTSHIFLTFETQSCVSDSANFYLSQIQINTQRFQNDCYSTKETQLHNPQMHLEKIAP